MRKQTETCKFEVRDAILVFLYSTAISLLTMCVNGVSLGWSAIIGSICYMALTAQLARRYEGHYLELLFLLIMGRIWLELPVRAIDFKGSLFTLMVPLFIVWNILMTTWYMKNKSKLALGVGAIGWSYFILFGHIQWMEFSKQQVYSLYDFYVGVISQ